MLSSRLSFEKNKHEYEFRRSNVRVKSNFVMIQQCFNPPAIPDDKKGDLAEIKGRDREVRRSSGREVLPEIET